MKEKENYFIEEEIEDKPPERALLAAMLDRVIRDTMVTERTVLREVDAYINTKLVKNPKPFSFQYLCEALDLDPVYMRFFVKTRNRSNYNPT